MRRALIAGLLGVACATNRSPPATPKSPTTVYGTCQRIESDELTFKLGTTVYLRRPIGESVVYTGSCQSQLIGGRIASQVDWFQIPEGCDLLDLASYDTVELYDGVCVRKNEGAVACPGLGWAGMVGICVSDVAQTPVGSCETAPAHIEKCRNLGLPYNWAVSRECTEAPYIWIDDEPMLRAGGLLDCETADDSLCCPWDYAR
jgi:hypothetical protein